MCIQNTTKSCKERKKDTISNVHTSHLDARNLKLKNVQQGKSQRRKEKIEDTLCTQCIVKSHKEQEEESDHASHSSFVTKC
jgi:hypothetical protein